MKYRKITLVLMLGTVLLSCNKMLEHANINNNNPTDVPLPGLLPAAEVALAFNIAADFSIHSSIFIQQISGIGGFAVNYDKYNIPPAIFDTAWRNAYTKVLINSSIIIKKAESANAPVYSGIAKVLTAVSLGTLTDAFGDIPYKEALNPNILAPHYETQEAIYDSIQLLLSSGITDLGEPGDFAPSYDDVIFNGDTAKWIAAAWTLKARYALHLSKLDPQGAAQNALSFLYNNGTYRGIQSNDGDVAVTFGTANNQASPWFMQNAGRPGWYGMGYYFVHLLNGDSTTGTPVDPRRAAFAAPRPAPDPPNTYRGARAGVPSPASSPASNIVGPNTYYGVNTGPVSIISYPEAKFIEAEAKLILNPDDASIQTVLEQAVRASFAKVTSINDTFATAAKQDDYISKVVVLTGDAAQKEEKIITQKYIALYLNPEAWVDYRRTGYPELTPATGGSTAINPNGGIPRKFAYPNSEATLNPNIPYPQSDLQTPRLWWDKQ